MGYCFQLRAYDDSGNFIDRFEYAGAYGACTMATFLEKLRDICYESWNPVPDFAFFFLEKIEYDFVSVAEILECFEGLEEALAEGKVKWEDKYHEGFFKDFKKVFKLAEEKQGYVEQTLFG